MKKFILLLLFTSVAFTSCEVEQVQTEAESQDLLSSERSKEEKGCETAFAYYKDGCFLDDEDNNFNRWGWVIGPLKENSKNEYDIYQAAGKCDINKGELIGSLYVTYTDDGTVEVEYKANLGYAFFETHLYVGKNKYPTLKNGKPTVAPGKYPYKHSLPGGESSDYFKIDKVNGDIYIIAHAVVCPKEDKK